MVSCAWIYLVFLYMARIVMGCLCNSGNWIDDATRFEMRRGQSWITQPWTGKEIWIVYGDVVLDLELSKR